MNKACFIGRLTSDPESRFVGEKVLCMFTLAVSRDFKNSNGTVDTDFIPVQVWGSKGENCIKYLQKGSQVAVEAQVRTGSSDTENGKRYFTNFIASKVEFLSKPKNSNDTNTTNNNNNNNNASAFNNNNNSSANNNSFDEEFGSGFDDEDMPF